MVELPVQHVALEHRFIIELPEGQAVLDYRLASPTVMEMYHTFTPNLARGQGIASKLVTGALDYVRANHFRIIPACWYVDAFMQKHVEYRDLLDDGRTGDDARAENPPVCEI